ncbi:hypothetical protein B0D71_00185 [Pseudomonas laurylsulfativorans]|uniref:Uncharacterized protein n=1 Tax=Pseudomonas laurylsulfativorans TaxID=1943631 RepID=A0A2S3VTL4_9PSED|nr:hypothetical protein B0D71_00185 [Pseudomonas laurylsulfativorans]
MNLLMKSAGLLLGGFVLMCALEVGETLSIPGVHSFIPQAEAVVGRPLTPVSVAGVARRTARRN